MNPAIDLLASHPLFSRLRREQVERFAHVGQVEDFFAGEIIVAEGTPADAMYLILAGTAEVDKRGKHLAALEPGDFFGEMSLMEPLPRSASVTASSPAQMFRIPYFELQNLLENDAVAFNQVLVSVVRVLSERLRRANAVISSAGQVSDWLAGSLV